MLPKIVLFLIESWIHILSWKFAFGETNLVILKKIDVSKASSSILDEQLKGVNYCWNTPILDFWGSSESASPGHCHSKEIWRCLLLLILLQSSYCYLVKEGWALKVAYQFTIRGLVAYKLVAYKCIFSFGSRLFVRGLFLYPLKTSENHSFSDVFRGYRKRSVGKYLCEVRTKTLK